VGIHRLLSLILLMGIVRLLGLGTIAWSNGGHHIHMQPLLIHHADTFHLR
jgi:hypothetical protein